MKRVLTAILALILMVGLLVTGCSSSSKSDASAQSPEVGKLAPDFSFPISESQSMSLSDLRGRPLLINFWTTWCSPCRAEMPSIQEIYDDAEWLSRGLVILAVNVGESQSIVQGFLEYFGLSFPVLLDTRGDVAMKYRVRAFPTTFLIDKNGIIKVIKYGAFFSKADIEKSLSEIIP